MAIEKELIVTNVTEVKVGKYGAPRITINLYESPHPDPDVDMVYMITIGVTNEILQGMLDKIGINDNVKKKKIGNRVKLPTGIRVKVSCGEEISGTYTSRVKFLSKVTAIDIIGDVREPIDRIVPARDVIFNDWGIIVQTMDGEHVNDKFLFFAPHLPEKVSSLMNRYKFAFPADTIHVKGESRVHYVTYPANDAATKWIVKPLYRFDSRFDVPGMLGIEMHVNGIKAMYLSKLKKLKGNPDFVSILKTMMTVDLLEGFVSESSIIERGRKSMIDIDPNFIPSLFLSPPDIDRFYYLKSTLSRDHDVYYHVKNKERDFKYVAFHDTGIHDINITRVKELKFHKLILYDVKFNMLYFFTTKKIPILPILDKIRASNDILSIDSVASNDSKCTAVKKLNIPDRGTGWMEETWDFMTTVT